MEWLMCVNVCVRHCEHIICGKTTKHVYVIPSAVNTESVYQLDVRFPNCLRVQGTSFDESQNFACLYFLWWFNITSGPYTNMD